MSKLDQSSLSERLDYWAVPFQASLVHDVGSTEFYRDASSKRIEQKLARATLDAVERELFPDLKTADTLNHLASVALHDTHTMRILRNPYFIPEDVRDDVLVAKAQAGLASPGEVLTIVENHPRIGAAELAKLSHPFNFDETQEMDDAVLTVLDKHGAVFLDNEPKYKIMPGGRDDTIPAVVPIRKQHIASLADGDIQIVKRQSLLVHAGEGVESPDPSFKHIVRNPNRFHLLAPKIEGYLTNYVPSIARSGLKPLRWLMPLATSYYAKYRANDK